MGGDGNVVAVELKLTAIMVPPMDSVFTRVKSMVTTEVIGWV